MVPDSFLKPLRVYATRLQNESEFESLPETFTPLMHTILLVWRSSAYYNTAPRLVLLLQEVTHTLIRQARAYLSGDKIFSAVDAGETKKAIDGIHVILKVFGRFKSVYFEYKVRPAHRQTAATPGWPLCAARWVVHSHLPPVSTYVRGGVTILQDKSVTDVPENPWRVTDAAIFGRYDSFLERCNDVLELTTTILHFSKLAKTEIGGTKGKTLTSSVNQIYADFCQAVEVSQPASLIQPALCASEPHVPSSSPTCCMPPA